MPDKATEVELDSNFSNKKLAYFKELTEKLTKLIKSISKPINRNYLGSKKKFIENLKELADFNKTKDFYETKYTKVLCFKLTDSKKKI